MNIKKLVTKEQYEQLKKEYSRIFPLKEVSFFDFCTKTFKLNK